MVVANSNSSSTGSDAFVVREGSGTGTDGDDFRGAAGPDPEGCRMDGAV